MIIKKSHIVLFFLGSVLLACRKDYFKPKWDVDVSTPLIKTDLSLDHFIPDSLLETNDDGTLLLHLDKIEYKVDLNGFGDLFDTSFVKSLPDIPFSTKVPPGYRYISDVESNIGAKGIELNKVLVKSGKILFTLKSSIEETAFMTYELKNTFEADTKEPAIVKDLRIPPAISGNSSTTSTYFDLTNYEFDLRGKDFTSFNTILSEIDVKIDPNGDSVMVGGSKRIELTVNFQDIIIEVGRGYLGQEVLVLDNKEEDLGIFNTIKEGKIKLEDVELKLDLKNYLGADLKSVIKDLYIVSVAGDKEKLTHKDIGKTLNFSRAKEIDEAPVPSVYSMNFNKDNSNILKLMEALPNKIGFNGDFELNPMGNISNGNDFIYSDKTIGVEMELRLPLKIGIDGLTLADTLVLDLSENERIKKINNGRLMVIAENTFPIDASFNMHFLDINGKRLETVKGEDKILAGEPNAKGKVVEAKKSRVFFELDNEAHQNFIAAKKLVVESKFSTIDKEMVHLYKEYKLQLTVVGDFNYEIDTQTNK